MILNNFKEVDYKLMSILINKNNDLDGFILFSPIMEGNTFQIEEKAEIYKKIKSMTNKLLIYEVSSFLFEEEIHLIKKINPDAIMLTLIKEKKLSSKGHELYVINNMKKLGIPFYIHHENKMDGSYLSYQSIIRIRRILPTFKGVFEENNDYSFIRKLSSLEGFETYTTLINDLNNKDVLNVTGIISDLFLAFKKEIKEYYLELENHFINPLLKDYLEFVENVMNEYPRAMAIKYILSKGNDKKLYSRLPYYVLSKEEKYKLDYLF